ncbi:hypothetical protein SAMN05428945_2955 [Streptomyces sp. 2224.1]|nr:hypothetical protein SAMN05428945_2955 [Streptomyces sp. 2224.1]
MVRDICDAAESGSMPLAPVRGEGAPAGQPHGAHRDSAGEGPHPAAALVERAADLVEPMKPKLRGWLHAATVPAPSPP